MGNCHGGRLMTKNGLVRLERPECAVYFFGLFTSVFVNTAEKSEYHTILDNIVVVFQLLDCLRQILPDYLPRPTSYNETPFVTRFDNLFPFSLSTVPLSTASYENPLSIVLLKPGTFTISLAPAREDKGSRPTLASRTLGDSWKERHSGPEQKRHTKRIVSRLEVVDRSLTSQAKPAVILSSSLLAVPFSLSRRSHARNRNPSYSEL
ncbi:uncharacterized protein BDZ83DRAFT_647418 [Colletotrichum acutatum]|uniref:Uncharacterized protein n=1 Tax=Glomerella acutata TaxID=27357 RepID=A0AAD9D1M1_GLOAC|nr:uncharacterized protein BDZ83DRAFT_647418 [Colletotrichum acutatum]KAK1729851.1 hypothetical protein BDZ83DRAFT_647418 [Colletotrichum acutatum]